MKCDNTAHGVNDVNLQGLIQYLSENISTLHEELNVENFQFILDIIIEQLVILANKLIKNHAKVRSIL